MEFGVESRFEQDLNIPDADEQISEADVFVYDKNDRENFFLTFYCIRGETMNSHSQRVTDAGEEEYIEFVREFLDDPEIKEGDTIVASSEEARVSFDPGEEGGVLTYRGDFSDLEELYIDGREPLSQQDYREAIEVGLEELREGVEQINIPARKIAP